MVYDDAEVLYAEVAKDGRDIIEGAFHVLLPDSSPIIKSAAVPAKASRIVAVNTTPFPRREVVEVPVGGGNSHLRKQAVQISKSGDVGYVLVEETSGGSAVGVKGMFADISPASGPPLSTIFYSRI